MNQDTKDQEWQQLQFRIKKFVDGFLKENSPAIEHKTRIAGLLQSPPEYNEQNVEETA
ncbi:MAG: hypothetical protein WA096_10460 [Smithella sp.]